jgi:hypothetical protein
MFDVSSVMCWLRFGCWYDKSKRALSQSRNEKIEEGLLVTSGYRAMWHSDRHAESAAMLCEQSLKESVYAGGCLPDNLIDEMKNAEAVEINDMLKDETG